MSKFIGRNIRTIRDRWRMDQGEFAPILQTSRQMVSKYEKGGHVPNVLALIKIEDLSGIPVKDLITREIEEDEIPINPLEAPIQKETKSVEEKEVSHKKLLEITNINRLLQTIVEHEDRIKKLEDQIENR